MADRNECVVANPVPFSDTAPVRSGVAATILNAWLIWYHLNVEQIVSPVWGWSRDNDVTTSNHLSGTALDINAPTYPWGYRTMPVERIHKVRKGLQLFNGCVFWGADWDRADEMHFQIAYPEGDPRLSALAEALSDGYLGLYGPPTTEPEEEDMPFTEADRKLLQDVHRELRQPYPSRSRYRANAKPVDTLAGMVLNADARIHEDATERAAMLGDAEAGARVRAAAEAGDPHAAAILGIVDGIKS
ncbi:M15 family metallopeptidase [Nocardia sp. NPDC058518]|uniref:M15 family metallopeptidase n=1 Tax=Nocardia sp. NPDC058518 TaxID=3346534 RepID=UPI00365CAF45